MKIDSATFAVSLELCIVLFCAFSIVYLGNLKKDRNHWLLFAYFALGFPFLNLLLGEDRYGVVPYTPFLQNPAPVILFFPAIYLYTLKLIRPDTLTNGRAYLHFLPFILFYWFFVFKGFEDPEVLFYGNKPPFHITAFVAFNAGQAIVYLYLTLKLVKHTQENYQEQFADNSPFITLSWIKWMIYIIVMVAALRLPLASLSEIFESSGRSITMMSIIVVICILNYFSFRQPILYTESRKFYPPKKNLIDAPADTSSGLSKEEKDLLIHRLENFMQTEKPFLNTKIRMPDLAMALEIPRHVFSGLINEHYRVNFFHFINKYRVEYAKKLLNDEEYENYTLETIGEFSGFNSRSTFNRIFKNVTGKSPKEFRQNEMKT